MNRLVGIIFLLGCFFRALPVNAQCTPPDFSSPPEACLQESVLIQNVTPLTGTEYAWDFCSGDLGLFQSGSNVLSNSNFSRARSLRVIEEADLWHGFSISATANILMRLDFGADPGSVPVFTNLGNVGSALNSAFAFDMIKVNNVWHLFVANGGGNNILRYSFINGIDQSPVLSVVQTATAFSAAGPNAIRIVHDTDQFYGFVSVGTSVATSKIVRLDFGSSITSLAPAVSEFVIASANQLRGMAFVKECGQWIGLVISQNTNALHRLDFGNALTNPPATSVLNTGGILSTPVNIEVRNEGGLYYAFVQNSRTQEENAALYRISFGASITSTSVTVEKLMSPQLTGGAYALDIVHLDSRWFGYTFNLATNSLVRYNFENPCRANPPVSLEKTPPLIHYSSPGSYAVTLSVRDDEGNMSSRMHPIVIMDQPAPDIAFTTQNICAQHDVHFVPQNTSGNLVLYDWDFGDSNTSAQLSPTHQFASAGDYPVKLIVTADNGCQNQAHHTLSILNQPQADFSFPLASPVCTNQAYRFENNSAFDDAFTPNWQWSVNDMPVSSDDDFLFSFNDTGGKTIKLKATIPGCENEAEKIIDSVLEGPSVDFTYDGQCEDEAVVFLNTTSGDVLSWHWNFGDGQLSSDENPQHIFTSPSQFEVSLTTLNENGCQNSNTKTITIFSKPQANFVVPLPPVACSQAVVTFKDSTPFPFDSNLTEWFWDFDDGGITSALREPVHTFDQAGDYAISFTATTNFGCSSTIQKMVTIHPSPVPDFNHTPACVGVPVTFTDVSAGNIQSRQWQINSATFTIANPSTTFNTSGDKNLLLTVTDANGCMATVNRAVVVPVPLLPDFTVSKNCIHQQTEFVDITPDAADPIISRLWTFFGVGSGTNDPQVVTFTTPGNYSTRLEVTTQSGCSYAAQRNVAVTNPPQAGFTPSPQYGPPPLQVQFTNTSVGATQYLWNFNDAGQSTSTQTSPTFTYTELGQYPVNLMVFNAQGCVASITKEVSVVIPVVDIAITAMELQPTTAGYRPVVTLQNKSNVPIGNFTIRFDLSGKSLINDHVTVTIPAGGTYQFETSFDLLQTQNLVYVCAHSELPGELTTSDNTFCVTLDNSTIMLPPYPNPVSRGSELSVEWIAESSQAAEILLSTTMGQVVSTVHVQSVKGHNAIRFSTERLTPGLYIVHVRQSNFKSSFRLVVAE
jgi:PKD repeat protein